MKLTFKITTAVLITVMSLLLFFGYFIVKDEKEFLEKLQNEQGKIIVNTISISILDAVLLNDYPAIDTIVENTSKAYTNIISIRVIMKNKVVSRMYNKGAMSHEKNLFKSDVIIDGEILAKVVATISNFENSKRVDKRIRNMILISSFIAILLIVSLILIVKFFLINKINFISNSMREIKLNNLHELIEIKTNDEFKDLANNINEMTKKIDYEIKENKTKSKLLSEQSKMVEIGEMIGNIAHQWRQPLSVISTGATGIKLQKEYGSLSDEELLKTCDTINKNAQYLSQTIEDFRGYIKGDTKSCEFNIKENIESFLKLIEPTIKMNEIKIILNEIEDIKILGYPNELQQCFINIFNNSKDALITNNGNEKYFFIETKISENDLLIKLKDNAGGILDKNLNKIFEPYFTTKHQSIGTGLGLSMTYDLIVNSMNGTIEVCNVDFEYKGTNYSGVEFILKIPVS